MISFLLEEDHSGLCGNAEGSGMEKSEYKETS